MRHTEERMAEALKGADAKLATAVQEMRAVQEQREAARQERAQMEGELRALQAAMEHAQDSVREERKTLRSAVEGAEARCRLAVERVVVVEQERATARQELAACRIEAAAAAEASTSREGVLRAELGAARALADQLGTRCRSSEQQREVNALLLDEALQGAQGAMASSIKHEAQLHDERQRAAKAEQERRDLQRRHYLALHRPERLSAPPADHLPGVLPASMDAADAVGYQPFGGGVAAVADAAGAQPVPPQQFAHGVSACRRSSSASVGLEALAPAPVVSIDDGSQAPWWWGVELSTPLTSGAGGNEARNDTARETSTHLFAGVKSEEAAADAQWQQGTAPSSGLCDGIEASEPACGSCATSSAPASPMIPAPVPVPVPVGSGSDSETATAFGQRASS